MGEVREEEWGGRQRCGPRRGRAVGAALWRDDSGDCGSWRVRRVEVSKGERWASAALGPVAELGGATRFD